MAAGQRRQAQHSDYVYDTTQDKFWNLQDGTIHSKESVDAAIPSSAWRVLPIEPSPRAQGRPRERTVQPHRDIMRVENDQLVESSTWWPGKPQIVKDFIVNKAGFFAAPGRRAYNRYVPPPGIGRGTHLAAGHWIEHVKTLWPNLEEHNYFFDYCAHMLQFPEVKCNAAVVMSGTQGIGKDAALEPIKRAVGVWNCNNIDPDNLFDQFKPWLETLMLVVDEARPSSDEYKASSMYNILKPLAAAPPYVLPLNDKHVRVRYIVNVMRVFITTNDWNSLYIPEEDRRIFILHSQMPEKWHVDAGQEDYFESYWHWLDNENGTEHVAAWLMKRDISHFNPKAPVMRTQFHKRISFSWSAPEDGIAQALSALGDPDIVFGQELVADSFDFRRDIELLLKSPRKIMHRMLQAGYGTIRPPEGQRWDFNHHAKRYRARYAFVKISLRLNEREEVAMITQHANELMGRTGSNVTPLTPREPPPGF